MALSSVGESTQIRIDFGPVSKLYTGITWTEVDITSEDLVLVYPEHLSHETIVSSCLLKGVEITNFDSFDSFKDIGDKDVAPMAVVGGVDVISFESVIYNGGEETAKLIGKHEGGKLPQNVKNVIAYSKDILLISP